MKNTKKNRFILKGTAYIFFLFALVGFVNMIAGKFPTINLTMPKEAGTSFADGYKAGGAFGSYVGTYFHFYILPFFWGFTGWLLFKCGDGKVDLDEPEATEPQKISE